MNFLEHIVKARRRDVEAAKRVIPLAALRRQASSRQHRSLAKRLLEAAPPRIIAEVKKASPSAGLLRSDYNPAAIARRYEECGAVGVSVLTEPRYFQGHGRHLQEVRSAIDLPVLCKDFIVDAYQIAEAAVWGADAVLLIVPALDVHTLRSLYDEARGLGLEVIAEVHGEPELNTALDLPEAILGVNSRDLRTLSTDLAVARKLVRKIPAGRLRLAESGIRTPGQIQELQALGYHGFLIGETLLREYNPGTKLMELRGMPT